MKPTNPTQNKHIYPSTWLTQYKIYRRLIPSADLALTVLLAHLPHSSLHISPAGKELCPHSTPSHGSHVTPNVTVFGEGAFGRQLGLDEAIWVGPSWWDQCFHKRHQTACLSVFFSFPSREGIAGSRTLQAKTKVLDRNQISRHLDLGLCSIQKCQK